MSLNKSVGISIKNKLVKLFIMIVFLLAKAYAQISPGDLTTAHAKLEGLSNCTKCHVLGEQVSDSKCMECHSEIKKLREQGRGYHSLKEVKAKNCFECHSEHHGRNFSIVNFNPETFDHKKTGFQLLGSHLKLKCEKCHQNKYKVSSFGKNKQNSYLGLISDCISCHEDVHQKTLGKDCSTCHGNESFKPAVIFSHDNSRFKLTGAHQKAACEKCHPISRTNGINFQKFRGIAYSSCKSCHSDIHNSKFGSDCQSCHNTTSFHSISKGSFDHSKTNFQLVGKHSYLSCNECHKTNISIKLKHEKCTDCHTDYHKGEFLESSETKDCSFCHNEKGFTPSLFTLQMHNETKFALTGAHLAIACKNCHLKMENWHFRNIGNECINCHSNIHGNELSEKYLPGNDCSFCHTSNDWNTINFDHSRTSFVLEGKHKNVQCGKCHSMETSKGKHFEFTSLKPRCEGCHSDIHFGQFSVDENSNCIRCHTFNNWKPEKFDHEKTNFSLQGAHSKLSCQQCHKIAAINGNNFVIYKLKDFRCIACHS